MPEQIYLSIEGTPRVPTRQETSHYWMAKAILGVDGTVDDMEAAMWNRGWVRVVDYGDRLFAEQSQGGKPVDFQSLPAAQRKWLEDQVATGKTLVWNDKVFGSMRETMQGHPPA